MQNSSISLLIFSLIMAPGILGAFIPILPGIPYMFLVAAAYLVFAKWGNITIWEIAILAILCVISLLIDYGSGIFSSKIAGAAAKSTLLGFVCMIAGLIVFPPFGGFIGLFIGVFVAEYISKDSSKKALRSASYGLVGTAIGMGVNFLLSILFMVLFLVFSIK